MSDDNVVRLPAAELEEADDEAGSPVATPKDKSQTTRLIEMAQANYGFGRDTEGAVFAYSPKYPHVAMALRGNKLGLRQRLMGDYFRVNNAGSSQNAIAAAMMTLEGLAWESEPTKLHLRVAVHDGAVYIDMADEDNRVIKISDGSWSIINSDVPVVFRRTQDTEPLEMPVTDGTGCIDPLWDFVPIAEHSKPLFLAALVDAQIQPETAKVILAIDADSGSAKTSTSRFACSLLNPLAPPTEEPGAPPKDEEELVICAKASYVVTIDNLSQISPEMSNALCRLSTGGTLRKRQKYSDDDVVRHQVKRLVIMTSTDFGKLRDDITDRIVPLELRPLTKVKDESTLRADWKEARPTIFAGFLDFAAKVHAMLPALDTSDILLPRMADYGRVLSCVDDLLDTKGLVQYRSAVTNGLVDAAMSDVFIEQIVSKAYKTAEGGETAKAILDWLTANGSQRVTTGSLWPKGSRNVTTRLKNHRKALKQMGFHVDEATNADKVKLWIISPPEREDGEL